MLLPHCLTIAGSDPSGGAGIQGDLKTFAALGTHGMAVITALTAQNTRVMDGVFPVPSDFVARQIECLLDDVRCDAIKTGMLANREIVEAVAVVLEKQGGIPLVVDPAMTATVGGKLLERSAVEVLKKRLLPLAIIAVPNVAEAGILAGMQMRSRMDLREAAKAIHSFGPAALITGGDFMPESETVCDMFFDGNDFAEMESARIRTPHTHGSGCCLSAALCACLSKKMSLHDAVATARQFTREAILRGWAIGSGAGPVNPLHLIPRQQ